MEAAFAVLRDAFDRSHAMPVRDAAVALALLRRRERHRLSGCLVRDGAQQASADALEALAMYEKDPNLKERIEVHCSIEADIVASLSAYGAVFWASWRLAALGYAFRFLQNCTTR